MSQGSTQFQSIIFVVIIGGYVVIRCCNVKFPYFCFKTLFIDFITRFSFVWNYFSKLQISNHLHPFDLYFYNCIVLFFLLLFDIIFQCT